MNELDFHPAANIFPLMTDAEYAALVSDIAEHGQREAIWLHEGKVLDGRNRLLACNELGLVPEFREYTGDDPQSFVVSLNLHRRHLTREQRDEVIRQLRTNGMTLQKIAAAVGVSVDTAHRVTRNVELSEIGKLPGDDGKFRPMHYSTRAVELEPEEEEEEGDSCLNCRHNHYNRSSGAQFCAALGIEFDITLCPCNMKRWEPESEPEPEPEPEPRPMAHVGQNSGNNEWYTPAEYIEAARDVMGAIDLDPASSEVANAIVGATKFYTADDNGLLYDWRGKVWMNPPYAQPAIADFCAKMREEFIAERVTEAIVLVNNATETAWFQSLISAATAVCFPLARIRFWSPDRTSASPLQGQAVVYLGANFDAFIARFMAFGWCAEVA